MVVASSSTCPQGEPIRCIGKICIPDEATQSTAITVNDRTIKIQDTSYKLDQIDDQFSTNKQIYDRNFTSVISSLLDGLNSTILFIGSGRTPHSDLCSETALLAVTDLIGTLTDRHDQFSVEAQFVEIADDTIRDLFSNADPKIVIDETEWGVTITGSRRTACVTPEDFRIALREGVGRRTRQITEFGPMSDRATLLLLIDLNVKTSSGFQQRSRLMLADLPSIDRLALDQTQLRATEGLNINRQLISFGNILRSLSDRDRADFANFDESKTTMLLRDSLSSNVFTTALALIDTSDLNLASTTLKLMQSLQSITTFPVANDERHHGLLRRLRLRISSLNEEVRGLRRKQADPNELTYADSDRTTSMILEEKARVIAAERGRAAAVAAKNRITTSMNELKDRYKVLLEEKTKVQEELVNSEEERLRLAQALIDTQMQESVMKESQAKERYDLETKLLASEAETVELRSREKRLNQEISELHKKVDITESERQALALEYVTLRQNYDQTVQDSADLKSRNETLGFELLTLVNIKKDLEDKRSSLLEQVHILDSSLKEAQQLKQSLSDRLAAAEQAEHQLKSDNETLSLMSLKKDIELRQAQTEFESKKVTLERAQVDFLRQAEAEAVALRQSSEKEIGRLTMAKSEAEKVVDRLSSELKVVRRQFSTVEADLAAITDRNVQLEGELEQAHSISIQQTDQYRSKVLSLVEDDELKRVVAQLTDEHHRIESHQRQEIEAAKRRERLCVRQLRKLTTVYRDLAHDVDEHREQCRTLSDEELRGLTAEVAKDEDMFMEEVDRWKLRCEQATNQTAKTQEEMIRQAEEHRRIMAGLRKELDDQIRVRDKVSLELQAVTTAHSFCGTERSQGIATEVLSAIRKEMEAIKTQIVNQPVIRQLPHRLAMSSSPELEREVRDLREQIRAAKEAEDKILKEAPKSISELEKERASWAMKCARLEAQLEHLQNYLKAQMSAWDKERAALKAQIKKLAKLSTS